MHVITELIEYFLKSVYVILMFTLTVFEILLFQGKSVLGPSQQVQGSDRVEFSVTKNKKMFGFCCNCLKSDCLTSLGDFEWFLILFNFV